MREFPEEACRVMGSAFRQAKLGGEHPDAKVLKGFGGAVVLEVVEDHDGDTSRAVCSVKFAGSVDVLHAFQKKSKSGIRTSPAELELIRRRLKAAEEHHEKSGSEAEKRRKPGHH